MYAAYTILLFLALLLSSPWWLGAMVFSGKYREGLSERLGMVPASLRQAAVGKRIVWLHAVSVGELHAALPLINLLRERLAQLNPQFHIVVSTTTRTSQQIAREKFGGDSVFYFPLDLPGAVRNYFEVLQPQLVVLLETEFWPNFLRAASRRNVPLAIINARISDRSYPGYRRLRVLWKQALSPIRLVLAQSALDADRLHKIGIPSGKVHVTGNLKYDAHATERQELNIVALLRQSLSPNSPVWVCGSTADGEDSAVVEAHWVARRTFPDLVTILAPRHPERFSDVAAMLPSGSIVRSHWAQAPAAIAPGTIFLLDSVGELASVYSLATIAFVGNSMVDPGGGQNPLEPATHGIPMLAGPHMQNFRDVAQGLQDCGAMVATTQQSLASDLLAMLQNPEQSRARGIRGLRHVEQKRGAARQAVDHLLRLLPEGRAST